MADSAINIDEGSEQAIDTRTEGTNGNHRQVVVLGDPAINNGVAPVDATNGLAVDVKALPNEGQQTMANSISVAIASNQSSIPVSTTAAGDETTTKEVVGDVAEDEPLAGNPIRVGGRASTNIPTAMSADNDIVTQWLDRNGAMVVKNRPASTATLSNVSGSTSSVTILASNTGRLGATVFNDSTATLYLKFGSAASTTSFTIKLFTDDYYEVPFGYTGIIDGVWASATGAARVTEIT
jgi:hypothetical protein